MSYPTEAEFRQQIEGWNGYVDEWDRSVEKKCYEIMAAHLKEKDELLREALSKVPTWISLEKQYPPAGETVWLANPNHGIVFLGCMYVESDGEWCWAKSDGTTYVQDGRIIAECEMDDYDVTHWMPLPSPPLPHQLTL